VCVVLALVFVAYWLLVQIRRLRVQLRRPPESFWRERAAVTIPERRP
jgi:hypothetical protein